MRDTIYAALDTGDLAAARTLLEACDDTLLLIDGYADLARAHDQQGAHDTAIEMLERAIEHGYEPTPDARSDLAEFHYRAGRTDVAAGIWTELRQQTPDDVWLYNAVGLTHQEAGVHESAAAWFADGLAVAIRIGDPEGVAAQLLDLRRHSLDALGRPADEIQQDAQLFIEAWEPPIRAADNARAILAARDAEPASTGPVAAVALAWFPPGHFERALLLWPSLADDCDGVPHDEYSARLDGHARWLGRNGSRVQAMAPLVIEEYLGYCQDHDLDPEESRAAFAAEQFRNGDAIAWPPARNAQCWCGAARKYKKCCARADTVSMFPLADDD